MTYTQLTCQQRYQIEACLAIGFSQVDIARQIGVHPSTVCRELRRNRVRSVWSASAAQCKADARRAEQRPALRITKAEWREVDRLLCKDYSPEQVSARIRMEGAVRISPEWIYTHVYADRQHGGSVWKHLRCQKLRRKRYGSGRQRRGRIPNRVDIDERPAEAAARDRIGDWEGDTVIGASHKGVLVTLAERKSRIVKIRKVPGKHAPPVTRAVTRALAQLPCETITFDNGHEFTQHEIMAHNLECKIWYGRVVSSLLKSSFVVNTT